MAPRRRKKGGAGGGNTTPEQAENAAALESKRRQSRASKMLSADDIGEDEEEDGKLPWPSLCHVVCLAMACFSCYGLSNCSFCVVDEEALDEGSVGSAFAAFHEGQQDDSHDEQEEEDKDPDYKLTEAEATADQEAEQADIEELKSQVVAEEGTEELDADITHESQQSSSQAPSSQPSQPSPQEASQNSQAAVPSPSQPQLSQYKHGTETAGLGAGLGSVRVPRSPAWTQPLTEEEGEQEAALEKEAPMEALITALVSYLLDKHRRAKEDKVPAREIKVGMSEMMCWCCWELEWKDGLETAERQSKRISQALKSAIPRFSQLEDLHNLDPSGDIPKPPPNVIVEDDVILIPKDSQVTIIVKDSKNLISLDLVHHNRAWHTTGGMLDRSGNLTPVQFGWRVYTSKTASPLISLLLEADRRPDDHYDDQRQASLLCLRLHRHSSDGTQPLDKFVKKGQLTGANGKAWDEVHVHDRSITKIEKIISAEETRAVNAWGGAETNKVMWPFHSDKGYVKDLREEYVRHRMINQHRKVHPAASSLLTFKKNFLGEAALFSALPEAEQLVYISITASIFIHGKASLLCSQSSKALDPSNSDGLQQTIDAFKNRYR